MANRHCLRVRWTIKTGKGEKRKEGDEVCMHIVYIIILDRVVDFIWFIVSLFHFSMGKWLSSAERSWNSMGVMGIFDWVLHMENDDDEMLYLMLHYTRCDSMWLLAGDEIWPIRSKCPIDSRFEVNVWLLPHVKFLHPFLDYMFKWTTLTSIHFFILPFFL